MAAANLTNTLLLLENGANPNTQDHSGSTALHYASELGLPELVTILIAHGADVNMRDGDGRKPLDVARKGIGSSFVAVSILLKRKEKMDDSRSHSIHANAVGANNSSIMSCIAPLNNLEDGGLAQASNFSNVFSDNSVIRFDLSNIDARLGFPTAASSPRLLMPDLRHDDVGAEAPSSILNITESLLDNSYAANGEEVSPHKRRPRFRAASYLPLLPYVIDMARYLDLFVVVEQCADCSTHSMSLRHNEQRYTAFADKLLLAALRKVLDLRLPIRVVGAKVKANTSSRLGALELTLALKVNTAPAPIAPRSPPTRSLNAASAERSLSMWEDERQRDLQGWVSYTAYSKLGSRR